MTKETNQLAEPNLTVSFYLTAEQYKKLLDYCKKTDRSASYVIRKAIDKLK